MKLGLISFALGIFTYFYQPLLLIPGIILSFGVLKIISLNTISHEYPFFKKPEIYTPIILLIGFIWSFIYYTSINTQFIEQPMPNKPISGKIKQIEHYKNKHRITIQQHNNQNVRVRVSHKLHLKEGDIIYGTADLLPFSDPPTPYSFNPKFDAYFKKLAAVGRIKWIDKKIKNKSFNIRQVISDNILKHMQDSEAAIAHALVLGDKTYIADEIKTAYSSSGIAHLLAISGLHLMLLGSLIFSVIRGVLCCFIQRWNIKKLAAGLTIVIAFAYMWVAGMGYPIQRATIMLTIFMLAIILDRTSLSMRSVCFAALIILLLHPESLFSPSFQLSFAAVIPLIAFWENFSTPLKMRWLWAPLCSTTIATLSTLPFIALVFHQITLVAPITNLICIPIFTFFVMPLGILSVFWGMPFYKYWSWSISCVTSIAQAISTLPGSQIFIPIPSTPLPFLFMVIGGLWLCFIESNIRHWGWWIVAIGIILYRPIEPPTHFSAPDRQVSAWREGVILYTQNTRKGRYYLDEWCKVYGLRLKKSISPSK